MTQTVTALSGKLVVTGSVEGAALHLIRIFRGSVQHKFLRADIHAATPDDLRIAVQADCDYLMRSL